MSTNPFRDYAQFAWQICEEERQRDLDTDRRLRRLPGEMQTHVNEREIELQRLRHAALAAGRKTGHDQSKVERRVVALFDLCERLLLWEREAPRLTQAQRRERESGAGWTGDPAGDYLIGLLNQFPQPWQRVNDLAASYDGAVASESDQGAPLARLDALITRLMQDVQSEAGAVGAQRNEIRMRRSAEAAQNYQLIQRLSLEVRAQCHTAGVPFETADCILSQASELAIELLNYHADNRDRELVRFGELIVQYRSVVQRLLELRACCENQLRNTIGPSHAQGEQAEGTGTHNNPVAGEQAPEIPHIRGRKQSYDPLKDQEIAVAWQRASENGVDKKVFVRDLKPKLTVRDLNRLLNRVRRRKNCAD